MTLTEQELAQFHKEGFIILRHFVDTSRCEALLKVAQEHLDKQIEPIETEVGYDMRSKDYRTEVSDYTSQENKHSKAEITVRRLRQVYQRDVLFRAWMEDEEIRPILQQILKDDVVITTGHHNSIMTKMPHSSSPTAWHQDRRYWRYSDDNLVSIWLALGEESSANGVLEFIPRSHTMTLTPEQFDEKEYFSQTHQSNQKMIASKTSTRLQQGDVVLFHSLLLHRANKNRTDKAKISFVYTVKGSKTKAIEGTRSAMFPEIKLDKIQKDKYAL
jgi:phytanoyl-CoA hydroxylase